MNNRLIKIHNKLVSINPNVLKKVIQILTTLIYILEYKFI
jgi:hypothetical protein